MEPPSPLIQRISPTGKRRSPSQTDATSKQKGKNKISVKTVILENRLKNMSYYKEIIEAFLVVMLFSGCVLLPPARN